MIENITGWIVRNPWKVVLATLVFVFASGYGAKNIKLNADYRAFFSDDNPHLQSFEDLQDQYNKVDNVLIAIIPECVISYRRDDGRILAGAIQSPSRLYC